MYSDFQNYLKLHIDSKNSQLQYWHRIKLFFSKYNNFNQENIDKFLIDSIDNNLKPSTFNGYMAALKCYAIFKNLDVNFPKQKKINKSINRSSVTPDELEKEIFPYFPLLFPFDYEKRKLILRFMILTGVRISEVTNLKKEDFNFSTKEIEIKNSKGKVDRIVYIHPSIESAIKNDFKQQENTESAFNINNGFINYIFKKIKESLGYKKHITPHSIRHGGAKLFLKNGMPINELMILLGHKKIETTMIYSQASKDEIKDTYFKKIKYKIGRK